MALNVFTLLHKADRALVKGQKYPGFVPIPGKQQALSGCFVNERMGRARSLYTVIYLLAVYDNLQDAGPPPHFMRFSKSY